MKFIIYFFVLIIVSNYSYSQNENAEHLRQMDDVFECNNDLFLIQNENLSIVEYNDVITFNSIQNYSSPINGIGYNTLDNYIYGVDRLDGRVYRLKSDGTLDDLGIPTGMPVPANQGFVAGDIDKNGVYIVSGYDETPFIHIDISGPQAEIIKIVNKPFSYTVYDILYDPFSDNWYAPTSNGPNLILINMDNGSYTNVGASNILYATMGSLFIDANQTVYGYSFDKLVEVNQNTGQATLIATGPPSERADGCSCPYRIDLFKQFSKSTVCENEVVSITFKLINNTSVTQNGISLVDNLPEGGIFTSNPNTLLGGSLAINSGLNQNSLQINNISLPEGVSEISIDVSFNNTIDDTLFNHAFLTNLPVIFSDTIWSDDVTSVVVDDPTPIQVLNMDTTFINFSSCNAIDTGTIIQVLQNSNGCDSVISTTTNYQGFDEITISETSCNPLDTGVIIQNLLNDASCDSIVTTITSLEIIDTTFINLTSCNAIDTGVVIQTLQSFNLCDSIVITSTSYQGYDETIINSTSCNTSDLGTFIEYYQNISACDSNVITIVTLENIDTTFINLTSCNAIDTGTTVSILQDINLCDSIVVENITYQGFDEITVNNTSCNPSDTGINTEVYQNIFACDSIVNTITTFEALDTTFINLVSCNAIDTGIIVNTFQNINSCDSIVITNTVLGGNYEETVITLESCNAIDTGTTITSFTNIDGCDSVITTIVNYIPVLIDTIFQSSHNPLETGIFTDTIFSTDNCDSIYITAISFEEEKETPEIIFPTAFTPNGDGVNDFFQILTTNIKSFIKLTIYNRWGELVFETDNIETNWDGTYRRENQEMDWYIVYVTAVMIDDKQQSTTGGLFLIR